MLPLIIASKAIYFCWYTDTWTLIYFIQHVTSSIPFFGKMLSYTTWGDDLGVLGLTKDTIQNNQITGDLLLIVGIVRSLGWSFFETIFADFYYIKIPAVDGRSHDLDKTSSIEKPAVYFTKSSDSGEASSGTQAKDSKNPESGEASSGAQTKDSKNPESGEVSSSSQGGGASSKSESRKGVITESDYEWESSSDSHYESDSDHNESGVSKFINSSQFEERVKKATKEELVEALSVIEFSIKSYEKSKVPVAKEQISILTKKENLCISALENKLIEEDKFLEEEKSKGKGKSKDN